MPRNESFSSLELAATLCALALLPLTGCAAQWGDDCTFSDGSSSCDSGPVLASELDGEFCTASGSLCLESIQERDGSASYVWRNGLTDETIEVGTLSGGLEFTSDSGRYYAASVDWSDNGIVVYGATLSRQSVPYRLALEYQDPRRAPVKLDCRFEDSRPVCQK